jgi:hypothetical protein
MTMNERWAKNFETQRNVMRFLQRELTKYDPRAKIDL